MDLARSRPVASVAALALTLELSSLFAQSRSTSLAHRVGEPVATIIEFGEQYLGSELYDAKITVLEVARGEKAWDIVKQASASNLPPRPAFEYLLARVRFEFSARTLPAPDSYHLNQTQFTATDSEGREFTAPTLDGYPQPPLQGTLKPGDRLDGWLAFLVPKNLSNPLMVFREDVGEVSHRGGGTWFELYTLLKSKQ
jgi:Domain of unknown function (DUF4352)